MNKPTLSPLSQAQWEKLEALASQASEALQNLSLELLMASEKADPELARKLLSESGKTKNAYEAILGGYYYHPQSEWTGGESFKTVEPHISGQRRTVA